MSMNTDRIAEIIAGLPHAFDVLGTWGPPKTTWINKDSLMLELAMSFKAEANRRRVNCICGPDCAAEDCNFDQVEFKRKALGL